MIPDDPFYQPRPARSLPRAMAIAPTLDPAGARAIDRGAALLVNPFYVKSPYGSFGKHVLTPSLYKHSNRLWRFLIEHQLVHAAWRPLIQLARLRRFGFGYDRSPWTSNLMERSR